MVKWSKLFVLGLTLLLPSLAAAQGGAYSSSFATGGGVARSAATSQGNAQSTANASAHGGVAEAYQHSVGMNGGFASGVANATTIGGMSRAVGNTQALGPCAVATGNTFASSHFGQAVANNTSVAGPCGQTHVNSTALSNYGVANSDAYGYAMNGSTFSDSLSHSFGPFTVSRSYGYSQGQFGGQAHSYSVGVGIGVNTPVFANSAAQAVGQFGAVANAQASHIVYGGR